MRGQVLPRLSFGAQPRAAAEALLPSMAQGLSWREPRPSSSLASSLGSRAAASAVAFSKPLGGKN